MCVYCTRKRLESQSVKTIMCSKLPVSMSGLCASERGIQYGATSQPNKGFLNHVEQKSASEYSFEYEAQTSSNRHQI